MSERIYNPVLGRDPPRAKSRSDFKFMDHAQ